MYGIKQVISRVLWTVAPLTVLVEAAVRRHP
jgi:hypothetical protein